MYPDRHCVVMPMASASFSTHTAAVQPLRMQTSAVMVQPPRIANIGSLAAAVTQPLVVPQHETENLVRQPTSLILKSGCQPSQTASANSEHWPSTNTSSQREQALRSGGGCQHQPARRLVDYSRLHVDNSSVADPSASHFDVASAIEVVVSDDDALSARPRNRRRIKQRERRKKTMLELADATERAGRSVVTTPNSADNDKGCISVAPTVLIPKFARASDNGDFGRSVSSRSSQHTDTLSMTADSVRARAAKRSHQMAHEWITVALDVLRREFSVQLKIWGSCPDKKVASARNVIKFKLEALLMAPIGDSEALALLLGEILTMNASGAFLNNAVCSALRCMLEAADLAACARPTVEKAHSVLDQAGNLKDLNLLDADSLALLRIGSLEFGKAEKPTPNATATHDRVSTTPHYANITALCANGDSRMSSSGRRLVVRNTFIEVEDSPHESDTESLASSKSLTSSKSMSSRNSSHRSSTVPPGLRGSARQEKN